MFITEGDVYCIVGDILSTVGVFSTVEDIMINVGDILSNVGKNLLLFEYPTILNTPQYS